VYLEISTASTRAKSRESAYNRRL